MKKIIVSFSAIALLLAGCGGVDRSMYPYEKEVQGGLEAISYKPGNLYTHVIRYQDEAGLPTSMAAKSTTVNLNKYTGRDVKASGMIDLASDDKTEILEVDQISLVVTPNMEFVDFDQIGRGFTVSYPEILEPTSTERLVEFELVNMPIYSVSIVPANTTSLESEIEMYRALDSSLPAEIDEKEIEIDGVPAILERKASLGGEEMRTVYVLGANNFYIMKYTGADEENSAIWKKLFDTFYKSFTAEDLDPEILTKTCTVKDECEEGQTCLLDSEAEKGICLVTEAAMSDVNDLVKTCNNSQGFLNKPKIYCEPDSTACTMTQMPTCECTNGLVWDDLQGCIAAAQVSENPTVAADPVLPGMPAVADPTTPAVTPSGTETVVPEDMREMVSGPWKYKLYYPSNWYYTGIGNGAYIFSESSKPEQKPAVVVRVVSACQNPDATCITSGTQKFEVESYSKAYDEQALAIANTIISEK